MVDKPTKLERRYLAYLLRLWQESAGDTPADDPLLWRASLESPRSEKRQGFASLADLFAFLERETETGSRRLEHPDQERPPG